MSHNCKRENSWLGNHGCCVCFDETDSLNCFKNENEDKKKISGPLLSTFGDIFSLSEEFDFYLSEKSSNSISFFISDWT